MLELPQQNNSNFVCVCMFFYMCIFKININPHTYILQEACLQKIKNVEK